MKWMSFFLGIISLLLSPLAFAIPPVLLSEAQPAIAASYFAGTSNTVVYTITSNVHESLPLSISGISGSITRTVVAHDCGNVIPAGPSTCNIGITLAPTFEQIGSTVSQTLQINYQGRESITTFISFKVIQPFAYVTPFPGANLINQCTLDSDGKFSSCFTAYSNDAQAYVKLTFATVAGVQYAYVTDQNGFVYQCTLNSKGGFNVCKSTPSSPVAWQPHDIAFATVGGVQYAYVSDVNGNIFQCFLDSKGNFINCISTISGFYAPYAIDFATVSGVQYAYVGDAGPGGAGSYGQVYQCSLNGDGSFNRCWPTPTNNTNGWIPYGIAFTTIDDVQYAYVADNGSSPTTGHVYRCSLNPDGSFNTCVSTPRSAPTNNWVPSDIAFTTLSGKQYAYVPCYQSNLGNMYQCDLRSDGFFNLCTSTPNTAPTSPWTPVGIAFRFN